MDAILHFFCLLAVFNLPRGRKSNYSTILAFFLSHCIAGFAKITI